ncbi:MAG: 3-phosphoshikimate 1-carboxyvinyltransferase [Clostridia bacterium]|nr:3-phosphoshikimate 1-carboxyvinyltransferase [Clostridia bacterium]
MNYTVQTLYGKIKNGTQTISVPGSKSITARALLIATVAHGVSVLKGVQFSEDCQNFLNCINGLGIKTEVDGTTVKVYGCGGKLPVKSAKINVGSAGTAARFVTAFLAFCDGEFLIDSSEQMKKRPQEPLINALKNMGATFKFLERENAFPFIIKGAKNPNLNLQVNIDKSSQYLSALLISAVCANAPVKVQVSGSHGLDYVNMTVKMMRSFGVNTQIDGAIYCVEGQYKGVEYDIEPDISAACYFYAINKICNTNISVEGVNAYSMQGDYKFIELIKNFNGGRVDMSAFSDQALTLAAVAPYLEKPTEICGVAHIRGQESNRIAAIVENLTAMGVRVEEYEDGVKIYPSTPHGAKIKTFGDHRVAMAFAVCGTVTQSIEIENCEVCGKTFKEYFSVLTALTNKIIN